MKGLRGKKPTALAGGTSKKKRHQWKSDKGQMFPRKKPGFEQKKKFIKSVYVWGWGGALNAILGSLEYIITFPEKRNMKKTKIYNAKDALNKLAKHFKRITPLPEIYKKNPEFMPIIFYQKNLPELSRLVKKFEMVPSKKTFKQIMQLVYRLAEESQKFRKTADKYGAVREIAKEKRFGF